jgi:hypothetical protein
MKNPIEIVLVNHARIGPLAGIIRQADGLLLGWEAEGRGVLVNDNRTLASWLIPWANIASVRLAEPETVPEAVPVLQHTKNATRRRPGRQKAISEPVGSQPCDKLSLRPILGK